MMHETVRLSDDGKAIEIIDQTKLPGEVVILSLNKQEDIIDAICKLKVRGAPAIGVAAAFGAYLGAAEIESDDFETFAAEYKVKLDKLKNARPTAVNLSWAIGEMWAYIEKCRGCSKNCTVEKIKEKLKKQSYKIYQGDIDTCRRIGEHGLSLMKPKMTCLTHCNAGRLATAGIGTALAPIYLANEKGYEIKVFCDETRPLLQGARLTTWELNEAGVDTTLACDNMVFSLMSQGIIDAVFVGCDRAAANGDIANKIGTASVAVNANHFGIPVYVCLPLSSIDPACPCGEEIVIEQRDGKEVTDLWYSQQVAPEGVKVYNPAFDVTPAELVTAIITEEGILYPPFTESIGSLFKSE